MTLFEVAPKAAFIDAEKHTVGSVLILSRQFSESRPSALRNPILVLKGETYEF
jgi:hypothetical protein